MPNTTPETDSARAAPSESAIEIAEELKPRSRSVDASSIATLVRAAYEHTAPPKLAAVIGKTIEIEPPRTTLAAEDFDPMQSPRAQKILTRFRALCLSLPETSEASQYGYPVWRAGKRTFALMYFLAERMTLGFWVGAEMQSMLVDDPRYRVLSLKDPERGRYVEVVVSGGALVGATCIGDAEVAATLSALYTRSLPVPDDPALLMVRALAGGGTGAATKRPDELDDGDRVCTCNSVTAGRIRACASFDEARDNTRATTGCGGCTSAVRELLREGALV